MSYFFKQSPYGSGKYKILKIGDLVRRGLDRFKTSGVGWEGGKMIFLLLVPPLAVIGFPACTASELYSSGFGISTTADLQS